MPDLRQIRNPATPSPQIETCDTVMEPDIVMRARHIVEQHGQLSRRSADLHFAIDGETLVVSGSVPTYYLKQLVQTALKGLQGVRQIDNQVEVVAGIQ
jgi:hypothetical protein